jgi:diguanylate cyclase (GGDEF)-like protein/PAS domain S-box-containing protein
VNWHRIPHQVVLAFTFGLVGLGLAAAILRLAAAAVGQASDTITYATTELQGMRYLARTHTVLAELLDLRAGLVKREAASRTLVRPGSGPRTVSAARIAAISAAIGAIPDRSAAPGALDAAISVERAALRDAWKRVAGLPTVRPQDVSASIAPIQPLLVAIFGASGISNDPSTDGVNFGDAMIRFPVSLADGSKAASIAAERLAVGDVSPARRFEAARLLARAQTAIDVGRQDAEDEVAVDPIAGAAVERRAIANVRDFKLLTSRVTGEYVEPGARPAAVRRDDVLLAELDGFTVSSIAVIDTLGHELARVTSDRIAGAQRQRTRLLAGAFGGIGFELAMMLALAWISISSFQNQRKRTAAERLALESQRSSLEARLTQATAQEALLRAKAQFRAVFDRAPTGMIIVDRQCKILDTNEAAAAMLTIADDPMGALDVVTGHAAVIEQMFAGTLNRYSDEHRYFDRDATQSRWFHVLISPVHDESGAALFAILMIRDITENKSMEAQLVFEAEHDALTGLPNRKRFVTLLQQALDARDPENPSGVFSVVFIDFNDFKTINDSFGHQAGDKFLVDGAARLRGGVRSTDAVARIGGDEFAVLLHGTDRWEIEKTVMRLQSLVSVPVNIEGQLVASSASFGVAQAELSYALASEVIRDADTAMYQAKGSASRNFVVFDQSMRDSVVRRMQLSIDIVHALKNNALELLYQPIVDLRDGRISGCEALVRWRRADGALISPAEFLPLAEENGSIINIGHWVIMTACEQIAAWNTAAAQTRLPGFHDDFVMHINLAVPEVHHVDLLSSLNGALTETGVRRDQLILEITEGIVLKSSAHTRATIDALTGSGFRLCIDDFGIGYSSLRYLNELPLHSFKIDRSFVSNGNGDLANVSIVEMLMVLSRSLGLGVVAEGIETHAQWAKLRELGCVYGQGYLFAPALGGAAFTAFLERDALLPPTPADDRAPVALR